MSYKTVDSAEHRFELCTSHGVAGGVWTGRFRQRTGPAEGRGWRYNKIRCDHAWDDEQVRIKRRRIQDRKKAKR